VWFIPERSYWSWPEAKRNNCSNTIHDGRLGLFEDTMIRLLNSQPMEFKELIDKTA